MTRGHRLRRMIQSCLWDVRRSYVEHVNRVAYGIERSVFTRHGKSCAVLVSAADAELLQGLDDEADVAIVCERLADGDPADYIPHDQIVAELSE